LIFKVAIVVKLSTTHYPLVCKKKKKKNPEGEGAPAPEKPMLSHFHYGNTTELGAAG